MRKILLFILSITPLLYITSCVKKTKNDKPVIVCTTGMIGDAVKNIVGEQFEVITLMGPGVDPHLYKPVQSDRKKLKKADVIIYNGLHLEGKMTDVLEQLSTSKIVLKMSTPIEQNEAEKLLHGDGNNHDPHIWFDVSIWKTSIGYIADTLSSSYKTMKDGIQIRKKAYQSKLTTLHQQAQSALHQIPPASRVLITAHDAFSYFGKAYDIEVQGLQGISTVSQAGIKRRKELAQLIIDRQIKAIFVESSVSERNITAIVEDCQSLGYKVNMGGTLFSDALGTAQDNANTYIDMVKKNIETITSALNQ